MYRLSFLALESLMPNFDIFKSPTGFIQTGNFSHFISVFMSLTKLSGVETSSKTVEKVRSIHRDFKVKLNLSTGCQKFSR